MKGSSMQELFAVSLHEINEMQLMDKYLYVIRLLE